MARRTGLAAPVLVAALLAAAYVIVAPPSLDLAAAMLRARLFAAEGFAGWDNWWYGGHATLGYSVLFPPLAAWTSPQIVGALAAVASAGLFAAIVTGRYGARAELPAVWFAAATAVDLLTGRLPFALGLMLVLAATLASQHEHWPSAATLAALSALASPVAALFAALLGASIAGCALRPLRPRRLAGGAGIVLAALLPLLLLALAFSAPGREPYALSAFLPVPVLAALALRVVPRRERELRLGIVLYAAGCLAAFALPNALGGDAGRLMPLLAGPLAALVIPRRRRAWLLACALPLLYLQWQAPVSDVVTAARSPAVAEAYWQPLLGFLGRQPGAPFRIEIPFTSTHWEAYWVAPHFALARGWERQLDEADDPLFYAGRLTAARYRAWLGAMAVRFVAVADTELDPSAVQEVRLIDHGLPYLRLVWHTARFRVYAVIAPTPLGSGAASATALGPDSVTLRARRAGTAVVRVRFSPYWWLAEGDGCVRPDGAFTEIDVRRPGRLRLAMAFSLARVGARSPRCRTPGFARLAGRVHAAT